MIATPPSPTGPPCLIGLETTGLAALGLGIAVCALAVSTSALAARARRRGPLEALQRRLAG